MKQKRRDEMSAISMPGFTADLSLYQTKELYRLARGTFSAAGGGIEPQYCFSSPEGGSATCCNCAVFEGQSYCECNTFHTHVLE
jgi:hypothetical protein